jgi:hypothetical protein
MGMSDDDGGGRHGPQPSKPISSAIDHDLGMTPPHEQRAVAKVAARSDLDLAACAEKIELDGVIPKA